MYVIIHINMHSKYACARTYICMYVPRSVCVCVSILSPVSKLYNDQLSVLANLLTCNKEEISSNVFLNTKNNK